MIAARSGFLVVLLMLGPCAAAGVDPGTGLVIAPGFETVSTHCTVCHSSMLITRSRATRDGWRAMIRWMQETQGLWSLGDKEEEILHYLATNYPPAKTGRRRPLPADLLPPR